MGSSSAIHLDLPGDLGRFRLPRALDGRLQRLLHKQDAGKGLTDEEQAEAEGLVELAETLTLLRLRAERADRDASRSA